MKRFDNHTIGFSLLLSVVDTLDVAEATALVGVLVTDDFVFCGHCLVFSLWAHHHIVVLVAICHLRLFNYGGIETIGDKKLDKVFVVGDIFLEKITIVKIFMAVQPSTLAGNGIGKPLTDTPLESHQGFFRS
jgi:hypothetical protein